MIHRGTRFDCLRIHQHHLILAGPPPENRVQTDYGEQSKATAAFRPLAHFVSFVLLTYWRQVQYTNILYIEFPEKLLAKLHETRVPCKVHPTNKPKPPKDVSAR